MELGKQQQQAYEAIREWYLKSDKKCFTLAGYAGTGKTTLAKFIAANLAPSAVFCAYTGKAAKILQDKGCRNASTIHGVLYTLLGQDKDKKPIFGYSPSENLFTRMIIVDEYSMLSKEIIDDLLRTGDKVLFLGDPFQLPPVSGKKDEVFLIPDFFLEEVHRQALESDIIKYATEVRMGNNIPFLKSTDFEHVSKKDIEIDDLINHEQVIVGRIVTKQEMNRQMREHIGKKPLCFDHGDKIMSLRSNKVKGILNGSIGSCTNASNYGMYSQFDFHCDGKIFEGIKSWNGNVEGKDPKEYNYQSGYENFEHAYAITCHKAQGSEFDSVLILNEGFGSPVDKRRWLYTAITRGVNKVTLVDMND